MFLVPCCNALLCYICHISTINRNIFVHYAFGLYKDTLDAHNDCKYFLSWFSFSAAPFSFPISLHYIGVKRILNFKYILCSLFHVVTHYCVKYFTYVKSVEICLCIMLQMYIRTDTEAHHDLKQHKQKSSSSQSTSQLVYYLPSGNLPVFRSTGQKPGTIWPLEAVPEQIHGVKLWSSTRK